MLPSRGTLIMATVLLAFSASLAVMVLAAEEDSRMAGRVPLPAIPQGQGESCVEDTDFMRRNHMQLLMHQRDETTLHGLRGKQHSLKECVSCHAVPGPDERPLTASSPKHFCRACHDYTAVKIDCFECHASRPDFDATGAGHDKLIAEMLPE